MTDHVTRAEFEALLDELRTAYGVQRGYRERIAEARDGAPGVKATVIKLSQLHTALSVYEGAVYDYGSTEAMRLALRSIGLEVEL